MPPPAIVKFPHPALRAPARAVSAVDDDLRALTDGMIAAMRAAGGVGLAAPQVARPVRLIVAAAAENAAPLVFFNPKITAAAAEIAEREEGCLSMPGISAVVRRPAAVTVSGIDRDGGEFRADAEGLLAACLQHEIDHLNGVLFVDHLSRLKKNRLLAKYRKLSDGRGV
ncbi:MAG: peptide deformylase [Gammaproteobacteria bacterium]